MKVTKPTYRLELQTQTLKKILDFPLVTSLFHFLPLFFHFFSLLPFKRCISNCPGRCPLPPFLCVLFALFSFVLMGFGGSCFSGVLNPHADGLLTVSCPSTQPKKSGLAKTPSHGTHPAPSTPPPSVSALCGRQLRNNGVLADAGVAHLLCPAAPAIPSICSQHFTGFCDICKLTSHFS